MYKVGWTILRRSLSRSGAAGKSWTSWCTTTPVIRSRCNSAASWHTAATTYGISTARPTRRVGVRLNAVQTIRNGSR